MTDTTQPTTSGWAAAMADDGLQPYDGAITLDADDKPFVRIHLAFAEGVDEADRAGFLMRLGRVVLGEL